ncbi:MAG: enoyl-CoA hydratase/isomerase family protein [Bacillota bacterium]
MNTEIFESITVEIKNHIATVNFYHPKSNSLPKVLLKNLTDEFNQLSINQDVNVIVLRSYGDTTFCAGASFSELQAVASYSEGKEFFMGFANLILAMKNCQKIIITRVQGKAVGGGVGLIAASDYVLAHNTASVKLSELDLGIGPFVVGPAIERKIGKSAFSALAIDTYWREASWAKEHGLYVEVYATIEELDNAVQSLAEKLSKNSQEAMAELKTVLWEGTEEWNNLLPGRAKISGRLVLSDFSSNFIAAFKNG